MKLFDTAAAATAAAAAAAAVSNDARAGSGTFRSIVPWVETTIYLVRRVAAARRSYCM